MKFTVNSSAFNTALSQVGKLASARSTLPALGAPDRGRALRRHCARHVAGDAVAIDVQAIVGPTPTSCEAYREALIDLAIEANSRAAQAFMDGQAAQGVAYLGFADRLMLIAGEQR